MSALGSLVVKLGLEYAQFTGGLDKSEQAALASAKRVQDTFDGMKSKLAATAGAIAGGLAAGFTVAAFKSLIGGAVATGAAFDDLAMQTGSTVEALSGLAEVGKFNDMGPEKIGAAMNVLTRNLAGATEESKGAGKALQALGLDFDKFKQMRPEDQMQAIAKAMAGFEDGTGKSAVAMALYGKEGAKMLPFMKDLASVGELQAKVTTEQGAAAAQLDDNWLKLTTTGSETAKEVAMGMVPAFDEAVRAAMDVMDGTGGMREMLRGLVADGSIKQWTTESIKLLSYVADAGHIAWRVLQSIGEGLGGLAAALVQALQGDFRGAWNALKDSGQDMIDTFDGPTIGARFRESLDKLTVSVAATDEAIEKGKPSLNGFANTTDKVGQAAKGAKGEVDKLAQSGTDLAQSLLAQDSGLSGDFHKKWDSLSAAYRANKISQDDLIAAQAQLLEQQPAMKMAMEATAKAAQTAADARNKEANEIAALVLRQEQAAEQSFQAVNDRIASLVAEESAISMASTLNISLAEAIERVAIARLREEQAKFNDVEGGRYREIEREIQAREKLLGLVSSKAQREDEARGWADMWQSVDRTAHDVFVNVLEGGQDAFKRLGNTLKASVLDVLYQMTVRKWIINIGTSVFGAGFGAAASAATGGGGAGGALSTVGSIGSAGSALGGLGAVGGALSGFTTAATASIQSLIGMSGTVAQMTTSLAAAGHTAATGVSAGVQAFQAIPGWGWAIAGVAALAAIFSKKSTPHAGAASTYSETGGIVSSADIYRTSGLADTRTYNAEVASVTGNVAKAIGDTLNSTAKAFGKTAGYEITTAFADDTSKDGAWGSLMIRRGGESVLDWRDTQTSKWAPKEFADGDAGSKAYLAEIAKSARDALVQAIGDVEWATDMLTALGESPTIEGLAQTVAQINAAQAAFENLGKNLVGFGDLTSGAIGALIGAAGGIEGLVSAANTYYENYYTEAEKAANVTRDITAALADVGLEMPKTRDEFRALVEAQMALGESGAPAVAALLGVSGAFAALTPTLDALVASVGVDAKQISTTLRDGLLGRISGAEMGEKIGTMITGGIHNAIAGGFADQITQIFMQGIVNPVIQAAMMGSSISAAVSQASIDAMVAQANAAASAIGAIMNDPGFQAAMAQISAAIGSLTTASAVGYRAPIAIGGGGSGGGGHDSGGYSDSVEAVDDAWRDLLQSIVESTLAAQTELSRLGMTSYERALAEIDDKANDLLKQIADDRGFAAMRTDLAGAEQRQSSFAALAESIRASVAQDGDRLVSGGTTWLSDVGMQYQREADAAAAAIARLRGELTDMPEEVRKLIEAERALLEARNALRAMEITGDLRTDIERLGMTDMERTLAGIGDRARDYIKSLEDIGQATEENVAVVDEWEKAMRFDAIKKAWEGVSDSMLDEIDRIRGVLRGSGATGFAELQAKFAIATAAARAGDQEAAKSLPELSRLMLEMGAGNVSSSAELRYLQARTAASLEETRAAIALLTAGGQPTISGVDPIIWDNAELAQPHLAPMPTHQWTGGLGEREDRADVAEMAGSLRDLVRLVGQQRDELAEMKKHVRRQDQQLTEWARLGVPVVNKPDTKLITEAPA